MIRHLAHIADIVDDLDAAIHFYRHTLGLPVEHEEGSPYAVVQVPGVLHFGLWLRRAAAETIYGNPDAYERVPLGLSVGFEVDDVNTAAADLTARGVTLLQGPRRETWGQATCRFVLPGGSVGEAAETPWARQLLSQLQAGPDAPA